MAYQTTELDLDAAMRLAARNKSRKYPDQEDARYRDGLIFPNINPSFTIHPSSSVFTIGSCFARNIEEALVAKGVSVPSLRYTPAKGEETGRPNTVLNQYNLGSMCEVVESTMVQGEISGGLYDLGDGTAFDALVNSFVAKVEMGRAIERRQQLLELYRSGLAESSTIVVTLGLIETWYDMKDEVYLNSFPPMSVLRAEKGRFVFRRLGVADCLDLGRRLLRCFAADQARNVVLTVSPVPLGSTFTDQDCAVANTASKTVLRVVAEQLAAEFDYVDYFPSYEMVTLSGLENYEADNMHVRSDVVHRVVSYMLSHYMPG